MRKLSRAQINKKLNKHKKYLLLIFLTAGLYFIRIFSNIISFKPSGFYAGHPNVWSDWALHITLTNTFANKPISEWFLYHPYFSSGELTYPSLVNVISGILIKSGLNITQAMIWPSIFLILLLLIGMYFLYFQIIKSRKKAVLGIFIFLTSAGPGFIKFFKEFFSNPNIEMLAFPPIDYTRMTDYQWLAGNIPTAMLIPQRAFLMGITIGVWSLLFLIIALQQNSNRKIKVDEKKLLITAGLLAGILPIAHMHSFIAVIFISAFICLSFLLKTTKKQKVFACKKLAYFVLPAGLLSTALYFSFISGGIENPNFMKISIGWTSKKNIFSWAFMWWKLWGIMIPLATYSLVSLYKNSLKKIASPELRPAQYFYGFFALFVVANIVIFQPTAWDNTKLFAWVYLGFSLLASHAVIELWKNTKEIKLNIAQKIISILLLIFLSTTGVLELIRLQRLDKNTYLLSSTEDIRFAKHIMENTKTDDIFLTSTIHNNPLQMWGSRSIVLGYGGWVTNFGFNTQERSNDVRKIFQDPKNSLRLIEKYGIDYVVIGDSEKKEFKVNKNYFDKNFSQAFKNRSTTIYSVLPLRNSLQHLIKLPRIQ